MTGLQGCEKGKRQMLTDRWRWAGSYPKAGAVCVSSDHGEAISWQVASTHSEGDEAGEVPGHKILQGDKIL